MRFKTVLTVLLLSCCAPRADQAPPPTPTIVIPPEPTTEKPIAAAVEKDLHKAGVQWYEMNAHAFNKAIIDGRIIMLYLHDKTCEPCVIFERATLNDPEVIEKLNREFMPIWVDEEMKREIEKAFGQVIYPSVIFLQSDGLHLLTVQGFVPPSKFELVLEALTTYFPKRDLQARANATFI